MRFKHLDAFHTGPTRLLWHFKSLKAKARSPSYPTSDATPAGTPQGRAVSKERTEQELQERWHRSHLPEGRNLLGPSGSFPAGAGQRGAAEQLRWRSFNSSSQMWRKKTL